MGAPLMNQRSLGHYLVSLCHGSKPYSLVMGNIFEIILITADSYLQALMCMVLKPRTAVKQERSKYNVIMLVL